MNIGTAELFLLLGNVHSELVFCYPHSMSCRIDGGHRGAQTTWFNNSISSTMSHERLAKSGVMILQGLI
jgi:hypothetical protein